MEELNDNNSNGDTTLTDDGDFTYNDKGKFESLEMA